MKSKPKTGRKKVETKIMPRFFTEPRASIVRILIEELSVWESTEKVTDKELLRLVDRLAVLSA